LKSERNGLYAMAVIDNFKGLVEFAMSANPLRIDGKRVRPATGYERHKWVEASFITRRTVPNASNFIVAKNTVLVPVS
jgi:hypothetical protein